MTEKYMTVRVSPRTVALLRTLAAIEGRTVAEVAWDAVDQLMREVIAKHKRTNQHLSALPTEREGK